MVCRLPKIFSAFPFSFSGDPGISDECVCGRWHVLTGIAVYLHTLLGECLCPIGQSEPIPLGDRIPGWAAFGFTKAVEAKREGPKKD